MKFLFPYLFKRFVNRTMSQQGFNGDFNQSSRSKNDSQTNSKSTPKDKLGDYVDFEEIDE